MIRIGIVDDHPVVRAGLQAFLSEQDDLSVVGQATSGREAINLVSTTKMDVLVLDLSMPNQGGIDALPMILFKAPDVGVLILSIYAEKHYGLTLMRHGASGYLMKDSDPAEIVAAVRCIAAGKRYISPRMAELLSQQLNRNAEVSAHERLSAREFQIFLKLAGGKTVGETAEILSLSVKTVSTYRTRVMEKLNLHSNSDLTYYALRNHLMR